MQKVLIIRFSSIGDIVLTSPILRAIKDQKPDVKLHFLTKKAYQANIEHNPHIDKLFLLENSMKKLLKELKSEKYDLIIDLHKNLRSQRIKFVLRTASVSFNKLNREKWMMVRFKKNHLPNKHIVDRYFDALKLWGIKNDQLGLEYYNGLENQFKWPGLERINNKAFVALVLGGTYYTKQIPLEKLREIINHVELPLVLLGGPGDRQIAKVLEEEFDQKVYNAVGKTNINESAELIRISEFVITGDTGLMHIAAAYQKRIYSLWGNTIPEFGMSPYLPTNENNSFILEVKDLKCRPCSKLGYGNCPKGHFDCMMKQDISLIQKQ